VSPQQGSVEKAAGVLSATQAIGAGTLPFTGFPIWVVVLLALALIVLGLMLRRRSRASSS
jgi:type III secretory pathway component EscV